jgi:hypothetical protein
MRVVFRQTRLLVALTLSLSLGLHWTVLQSVAWMGMIVAYSQNDGLTGALVKTFDGKHPCQICKIVKEGKRSEKKQEVLPLHVKFDFLLQPPTQFVYPLEIESSLLSFQMHGPQLCAPPPTPPPKLA